MSLVASEGCQRVSGDLLVIVAAAGVITSVHTRKKFNVPDHKAEGSVKSSQQRKVLVMPEDSLAREN